jgi:hypothetical protein
MKENIMSTIMKSKIKNWKDIRRTLSPEAEARIVAELTKAREEMPLCDLRRAREFTQAQLAAVMNDQQSSVSRLEKQADMYVSTLRSYIEAMGGELEVVARFQDRAIRVNLFKD